MHLVCLVWYYDKEETVDVRTPGLGQQFADGRSSHLCEERSAMNAAEMWQEATEVQLVSDDRQTRSLTDSTA